MKLSHLGKLALPLALAGTLVAGVPLEALACTQVWMPDSLTQEENTWYYGRAEDTAARAVKIFGVEPAHPAGFIYNSSETGFEWKSPTPTYRFTYVRDHGDNGWDGYQNAYSAAGINENGVSCSATLSTSSRDEIAGEFDYWTGSLVSEGLDTLNTETGIGEFNYASIVLGQSKTAREGVELLGKLVSEFGAAACDQIIVSDAKESWLLSIVSGHNWIAIQLPEDAASANPNMGSLWFKISDFDGDGVMHSEDLLTMPGDLLKTFDDGTPDIARTYADPDTEGSGQYSRYVIARAYFDSLANL